jgi:hypothetical protein
MTPETTVEHEHGQRCSTQTGTDADKEASRHMLQPPGLPEIN